MNSLSGLTTTNKYVPSASPKTASYTLTGVLSASVVVVTVDLSQ